MLRYKSWYKVEDATIEGECLGDQSYEMLFFIDKFLFLLPLLASFYIDSESLNWVVWPFSC